MVPKVSEAYKEEKRSELMESALQCFGEKGYEATTVDDIIQHAGVSKGMLYTYFHSKEEVFMQLLRDRTDRQFQHMRDLIAPFTSSRDKLRALLDLQRTTPFTDERRKWVVVQFEFWLSASRDEERQKFQEERYQRYISFFSDIIKTGQQSGEIRADIEPSTVAALYLALTDGIYTHFIYIGDAVQRENMWRDAERMLLSYLGIG